MLHRTHRYLGTFLAALLGVIVGSVGPGVARAAYDAVNADKVDGKHAVGAAASVDQRKGKLVATNATSGQLPNNIIGKALNSSALNGYSHETLRHISLPAQAAVTETGAVSLAPGPSLPGNGSPQFVISFTVPPDHQDGTPLYLDTVFYEASSEGCGITYATGGATGPVGGNFGNGGWELPPGTTTHGILSIPAGADTAFTRTFRWVGESEPGDVVSFYFLRQGDHAADTCSFVTFYGFQVRY